MKNACGGVVLFALIFCASSARAAEPDRDLRPPLPAVTPTHAAPAPSVRNDTASAPVDPVPFASPPSRTWYGWQTLLADAGATILLYTTAKPLGGYALVPYFTFAPAVHFANGRVEVGLGSAGLRFGATGRGGARRVRRRQGERELLQEQQPDPETDDDEDMFCDVTPALVGAFVGMIGAMVLDSTLLAWKDDSRAESGKRRFGSRQPSRSTARKRAWASSARSDARGLRRRRVRE